MNPVDQHISKKTEEQQVAMFRMREFLRSLLPEAEEVISYGMPAFKQKKALVYYEAFQSIWASILRVGPSRCLRRI